VEFVEKMIFQNIFRGKLQFFQPFFWGKFFRGIFRRIFPGKNVRKIGPWTKSYDRELQR
jgi:hypothetical protein